ncbi:hypothetical protein PLESTB_001728400 [Pleodorina starrii]|uniref:Fe2OG dioxygenase domain-containing protein n=1 Tax=Pleodorina starrii TaxID=330485 RepID=A0A9W6BZ14_9CHLO|nr:hypothetical protein PLESTB_001728400 [Pleodorina starrii]GLC75751.1 hypothetical protein PLESTF_001681500 [Pleodorina starrii]
MENTDGLSYGWEWCRRHRVAPHLPTLFYIPDYVVPEQEAQSLREARASKAKWVQLSGRRLQNLGGVVHAKGLIPAPLPSWLQPLLGRLAEEGGEGGLYGGQPPNHVLVNSYMPGEGIMPHEDGPAYHPVVAILSLGAPAVLRFRRKPKPEDDSSVPAATGGPPARRGSGAESTSLLQPPELPQQQQQQRPSSPPQETPESVAGAGAGPGAGVAAGEGPGYEVARPQQCPPYIASVLLQPRSLVIFRDEAFTDCLHCIEEVSEELLDESVANLDMYGLSPGTTLPRGGERISLTVRRVARVMPSILRPR